LDASLALGGVTHLISLRHFIRMNEGWPRKLILDQSTSTINIIIFIKHSTYNQRHSTGLVSS